MSEILISWSHQLSPARARGAAEAVACRLSEKFGVHWAWDEDALRFHGAGVAGAFMLGVGEATVQAQLGVLLASLKAPLEAKIHEYFDRYFV